jgi:hydrogenase nickel incorporation protein HypA/HybF
MHELAITQNILEIVLKHGEQAKAKKVLGLFLVIGQLSSVIDDSVQFYWDMVSQGTIAEGAELHFRRVPTQLMCKACGKKYSPDGENLTCPDCNSDMIAVIAGEEFYLESIEIDA